MNAPSRPALRYLGGKWRLAPWIISHFPRHRVYVEPFAGAASVLLRKPREPGMGECLNDLDDEIVNLFLVLRGKKLCADLCRALVFTPFARAEYDHLFEVTDDPVERARRFVARSYMGHGSSAAISKSSTGFRASMVNRGGALPAGEWRGLPKALAEIHERLHGVLIENRPAEQIIERYDGNDCLFYIDPPYLPTTRSWKRRGGRAFHGYNHEMTTEDHERLLAQLVDLKGFVVLSGYPDPLYDDMLKGWTRVQMETHADGALDRTEALWLNPRAAVRTDLFAGFD